MNDTWIELPKRKVRMEKNKATERMTINFPDYIKGIIDEEAKEKGVTFSVVVNYLVYSGLKAHVGTFIPPADNTIKLHYEERGRIWEIKEKD